MTEKVTATMILDAVQASLNGRNRQPDATGRGGRGARGDAAEATFG